MRYIQIVLLLFCSITGTVTAEALFDGFIASIRSNSPQVIASAKRSESERLRAKTGNLPSGPEFSLGYFPGNRSEIGTKRTIGAAQSFHFPTVYLNKNGLAKTVALSSTATHEQNTSELLVRAVRYYMQLVYLNKSCHELEKWVLETEKALVLTQKRVEAGDANLLDLQKARMEVVRFKNELDRKVADRQSLIATVTALNGGSTPTLPDTTYPVIELPVVDALVTQLSEKSPALRAMKQQVEIAEKNVRLQKSLHLPQFTVGYEEETILDDTYRGIQAGITIPLWLNVNKIRQAKLQLQASRMDLEAEIQRLIAEVHAKINSLSASLNNIVRTKQTLETSRTIEVLRKSLEAGNISILDYFRERQYWIEANDLFLLEEGAYHADAVDIMRYQWEL